MNGRRVAGILPNPHLHLFFGLGSASDLAGGSNHRCGRGGAGTLNYNCGDEFFNSCQATEAFQLNKSCLMHSINLIKQAPLSHYSIWFSGAPSCHAMPGQLKNHGPEIQKQWRGLFKTRRGHSACFAFLLRGDLKNYVLCYPSVDPLIIVIQVMLKFLSKLGKGLWACKTYCFMGMNQPCDSFQIPQSLPNKCYSWWSERKSLPHPKVNQMHIYVSILCVSLSFSFFSFPFLLWSRAYMEKFPCFSGLGRRDISRDRQ